MKSIFRFHWMNKKQQYPVAKFLLVGGIIAFAIFLLVPAISVHGLHKEEALLKKYNSLEDLVHDIRKSVI